MAMVSASGLTRTYRAEGGARPGIREASFSVDPGESVAICGRSGSGKTTLLSLLGLLDRPDGGRYVLDGVDVTGVRGAAASRLRSTKIGFVFQSFQLLGRLTILDNVALPARYAGLRRGRANERAATLLRRFGIEALAGRHPDELSGGQRQLAALCRSLVNDPPVVLADEPTGNIDTASAGLVMDHLLSLTGIGGRTLVLVTHDPGVAARCGRRMFVQDGVLAPAVAVGPLASPPR